MNLKIMVLFAFFLVLVAVLQVEADFLYNRVSPNNVELKSLGYKCIPGRTVMKVTEPPREPEEESSYEDDYRRYYGSHRTFKANVRRNLRSHTQYKSDEEYCQICVCSSEGKDEFCSKRSAMNVNECIRMGSVMEEFNKNMPFEHERALSYRIRRDYVWHNDEIPYEAKAKCRRGHAYYTNSINAKDTDIDVDSELESLLDYSIKEVCYYCVCSTDGTSVGCIARKQWYCDFYRNMRSPEAQRDRYRNIFYQDRPAFFRQLSYRLRRTMDVGMFDLMETGGDTLCCNHPSGHRRHLHNRIRDKIRTLKKKVNKENMMNQDAGGDYQDFVVNND